MYSIHNNPSIVAYLIFMSYFNLMRCLLRNVTLNVLKYYQSVIHVQNTYTVVTSLLLVFDYHARNTLTLYYLC